MKRVIHVTTVHPRDDIRIFRKECVSLARAGYEVVQVVSDGQGNATVEGVRIVDIGARPKGRVLRMLRQGRSALAAVRRELAASALVHIHDPELLPLAATLAREGVPVVYDAHEDVPRQILTKQWLPAALRPWVSSHFERYENRQVQVLAAVAAATPHIAARFKPVARRSVAVCNYPFLDELAPPLARAGGAPEGAQQDAHAGVHGGPRAGAAGSAPGGAQGGQQGDHEGVKHGLPRERAVCYVGGLMRTRGLLQMVRAVALVPGLRFIVCGAFEDAAFEAQLRAEPGWAQVEYLGQVGRAQVRQVLARSRAGLVTLLPLPSYVDSLPIKMFEYMSAELPVVASHFPLWQGIIERHGCGVCVDPTDVPAIAQALREIVDDSPRVTAYGRAGRAAVMSQFHWPVAERELLALYAELIGAP
jgi:glycosyltransferase involved in cell wall biosynthesis